jgi:hypothetical protein
MSSHTYRLAVSLQARALHIIGDHRAGVHTVDHNLGDFAVFASYRANADTQFVQIWARDHDARVPGSAQASAPCRGGVITSSVTEFRCGDMRFSRRVLRTPQQHADPTHLAAGTLRSVVDSDVRYAFHHSGRADYYLTHDWAPGKSPWNTTWSLLVGTPRSALALHRTGVDLDTPLAYAAHLETRAPATI